MPHTHFCKRKKEKKESPLALWRVSKNQVLRIKYYPTEKCSVVSLQCSVNWNFEGGDFIRNRRLELAFLNTRNKTLASFLSFFFVKMFPDCLLKRGRLQRVWFSFFWVISLISIRLMDILMEIIKKKTTRFVEFDF